MLTLCVTEDRHYQFKSALIVEGYLQRSSNNPQVFGVDEHLLRRSSVTDATEFWTRPSDGTQWVCLGTPIMELLSFQISHCV